MKYCVVIMDGAAGEPLAGHEGKTSLELARTPNLDTLVSQGCLGLARTVPDGFEPSSACACMSVMGYDPATYYRGRAGIEARSLGIPIAEGDASFRANLVAVRDGIMLSYSAGYISTEESRPLVEALNEALGGDEIWFYPGVGYRNLCRIRGHQDTLQAVCTAPHDIPGRPVADNLPKGQGSRLLREIMVRSEPVLADHPVNRARRERGEIPATTIWLFWGTGMIPEIPPFRKTYGLDAAMTSGVDLLRGLALMAGVDMLEIPGVTDGQDNDYSAQVAGALAAMSDHDLVFIHVEAPDEAAHDGDVTAKVAAIERIDAEILGRLAREANRELRLLVMPDHPTPVSLRTHSAQPVPFLLWGPGIAGNGGRRFTEAEALGRNLSLAEGHHLLSQLIANN